MKKYSIKMFALICLVLTSCSGYLDVNEDPNNPTRTSLDLVLSAAQLSAATVYGGGELGTLGGHWVEYYTQAPEANQYKDLTDYNITQDFGSRLWTETYAGCLNDLNYIINSEDGNPSYTLAATTLQIFMFQVMADLFDKVPYAEALNPSLTFQPVYDDGESIYPDLLAKLDAAIAGYEANPGARISGDLMLGNDASDWLAFAKSLKLKIMMRMSDTSIFSQTDLTALINAGGFISSNVSLGGFADEDERRNPWYENERQQLNTDNHRACSSLFGYLTNTDDERRFTIYEEAADGGFAAIPYGGYDDTNLGDDELSTINVTPTSNVFFMTVAQVHFLLAEAAQRFGVGDAVAEYNDGVEASFSDNGLSAADAALVIGPEGSVRLDTVVGEADRLKTIGLQRWVAMANYLNIESFFELNRTGYPEFAPTGTDPELGELVYPPNTSLAPNERALRLFYPEISLDRNANAPTQVSSLTLPIWWDN